MKKLILLLTLWSLLIPSGALRAEDPRVKSLLQEGLKLYGDHQYVRALDMFKQVQVLEPANATAEEYIKNTKQRILEWELQGNEKDSSRAPVTWDNLAPSGMSDTATNSKDIIAARKSLVDRMKSRSTNTDNIVQIEETSRGIDVTLFHDQLFVPGLQTLRDEALPILQNVADMIRNGEDKDVAIRCATHSDIEEDPYMLYPEFALPAPDPSVVGKKSDLAAIAFQDLETTRALILFTYLAQRSMGQTETAVIE